MADIFPSTRTQDECLRYWDLADSLKINMIVALWCDVSPSDIEWLIKGHQSTHCVDAKRAAIEDALIAGRLEYIDEGIPSSDGKLWMDSAVSVLISENRLRIKKESLRRWFEDMPIDDRPEFLFEEARTQKELPDGSDIHEMNSNLAIGVMAEMLAESAGKFKHGDKPNASTIGEAIRQRAEQKFGENKHGLTAFHRRITKALQIWNEEKKRF